MALKLCSLGSGSKGNSIYIENGQTSLLVDCGLTVSEIQKRLKHIGSSIDKINGVLITHEHTDHIKSAGILADAYNIPIYAHEHTLNSLKRKFGKRIKQAATFRTFAGFGLLGLDIIPFQNSHDVFTVGYSIADKESRVVIATDLGQPSQSLLELGAKADIAMLESNYDTKMLTNGRYPAYLKRRILSLRGHLSNDKCAETILKLASSGTKKFVLGHLSEENNRPELAYNTTINLLKSNGALVDSHYELSLALQGEPSPIIRCI